MLVPLSMSSLQKNSPVPSVTAYVLDREEDMYLRGSVAVLVISILQWKVLQWKTHN